MKTTCTNCKTEFQLSLTALVACEREGKIKVLCEACRSQHNAQEASAPHDKDTVIHFQAAGDLQITEQAELKAVPESMDLEG